MLNIRRGRRREHPMDTSEGVTTDVAYAHTQEKPEGVKWLSVTSGSHVTTTKKKKKRGKKAGHAQNILPVRTTSGQGLFRSCDFVTSGQKAPLGRIWHNFRLRMRRTYFQTGHVTDVTSGHVTDITSGHVTSGSTSQHLRKCDFVRTHILLPSWFS
jgi:hypothetical protein